MIATYVSLLPSPKETVNCIKKYEFVETNKGYRKAFTELHKLGTRYAIKSTMANTFSVANEEDIELFCKYYLKLS